MPSKPDMTKTIQRLHDALTCCEGGRTSLNARINEHWEERRTSLNARINEHWEERRIGRVIRKFWWVRFGLWLRTFVFRKGAI